MQDSMSISSSTYPTEWVYMPQYDRVFSKKFYKATKTAFAAMISQWLTGKTANAYVLATSAALAFGTYYFVNSDEEDVYTFIWYYDRELGPGKFGDTGYFMGDYQFRKVERITKSPSGTGGQVTQRYENSTIIEPFF